MRLKTKKGNAIELDLREEKKQLQKKKERAKQGQVFLSSVCNRSGTVSTHVYSVTNAKLHQFRCLVKQWSLLKYFLSCFSEISFEIKELNFQLPFLTITLPTFREKTKQNTKTVRNVIVNNERGISHPAFPILPFISLSFVLGGSPRFKIHICTWTLLSASTWCWSAQHHTQYIWCEVKLRVLNN